MRVVRVLVGIMLVTVAVLGFLSGGALWIATQHASSDGGFGGPVTGLSTGGSALVVPDVDSMLRGAVSLTGHSGTSVSLTAMAGSTPAFIGLAPIAAIRTYLGDAAYGRITSVRMGSGGLPVAVEQVPAVRRSTAPLTKPALQRFWTIVGSAGELRWSPSNAAYDQLALVIMRADGAGPVVVTAHAEVSAGWLTSTTWALFSIGSLVAIIAVALLMWPARRREIVYVVTPDQMPELAERLGVPLEPEPVAVPTEPAAGSLTVPAPRAEDRDMPDPGDANLDPDRWSRPVAEAAGVAEERPAWAGPTPAPPRAASAIRATAAMPRSVTPTIPAAFADPRTRPNSLRTAMLLNPVSAREVGQSAPLRTNERGTYRSFGSPPPVTPAFLWTPATTDPDAVDDLVVEQP